MRKNKLRNTLNDAQKRPEGVACAMLLAVAMLMLFCPGCEKDQTTNYNNTGDGNQTVNNGQNQNVNATTNAPAGE